MRAEGLQTCAIPTLIRCVKLCFIPFLTATALAADPDSAIDWLERMRPIVPRGYVCPRATGPLNVDGKLDDAAWQQATPVTDFKQFDKFYMPYGLSKHGLMTGMAKSKPTRQKLFKLKEPVTSVRFLFPPL